MRQHTLLIALPAFVLGCLVTAGLTTTAMAQSQRVPVKIRFVDKSASQANKPAASKLPRYITATSDEDLARFGAQGYEVKFASHTNTRIEYLMARY